VTDWLTLLAAAALGFVMGAWLVRRRGSGATPELLAARDEVSRRLAEVFALQELSFVLSESLQPKRIGEQVTGYLARFTDVQGSLVALAMEGGGSARVAAATGPLAPLLGREIPEDDAGLLIASLGREQMVHAEAAEHARPLVAAGLSVDRVAVFPLRAHGVTVGALAVVDPRGGHFTPETLRLLSTVATHAAIVLSNARFFDLVRAGRDQWETTFNALAEGLAVVDEHGRVRRANRALAALTERSVAALSGRALVDVLLPGSRELEELLAAARRGESPPPHTARIDAGRLLRIGAAPMRGEGPDTWAVVLVNDITEQEALETQLIQSEKMAAVGHLVSGVAHELNNPLTSIAGLAELLLEQPTPGERDREHLRVVREQAERAARIVRDLLTFARKGPAEVTTYDLNEIVQRTVSLVGYEVRLQEVRLDVALDPALPALTGDRHQIQQVVLNLVTNAIHAVEQNPPERPRTIRIGTGREGPDAVLRLADTGPGIPDALLPHIFTPFFTTKSPGQGTGLGLSISYRIAEGHGGSLSAQRGVDGGALFVMRLPIQPAVARPPARVSGPRAAITAGIEPGSVGTALVVDEDPGVRRMLSVLLTGTGLTVEPVGDTSQAAALLERRAYDLIVADARMPISAGERFADYLLRRWPGLQRRAVFLTADVRPDTEAWLKGLGCPFFIKPFRVGELKTAAAEILRTGTDGS
jgi:two-component system NtrC family sensor kinase